MKLSNLLSNLSWRNAAIMAAGLALLPWADTAWSQKTPRVSDVRNTPHNLSSSGTGTITTTATTEVCVFCHTPHGSNTAGPLWNRAVAGDTGYSVSYTKYTSGSISATELQAGGTWNVTNSSKLCLSCHDGTLAIGAVSNAPGSGSGSGITTTTGDNAGKMPTGAGVLTGDTRNLGVNLSNDHPISFTYSSALDTEIRNPSGSTTVANRSSTNRTPKAPLTDTKVECATCHDPHIKQGTTSGTYDGTAGANPPHDIKFLRLNRFQVDTPSTAAIPAFTETGDINCIACHSKAGWGESAHAKPVVADESYPTSSTDAINTTRDFPGGLRVWQAACLNCHDTHTASGARRLLRGGVSGTTSAIEETCYQCHQGTSILTGTGGTGTVPNIKDAFTTKTYRMPIVTAAQGELGGNTDEVHNIINENFEEATSSLGKNNPDGRHAECTDCHNPHRVRRASLFYQTSATTGDGLLRTHKAGGTAAQKGADGNVASGVLRGTWGVEPSYGTLTTWPQRPSYTVKKGDPGTGTNSIADAARDKTYLTREYQLCFRCHSDYATGTGDGTGTATQGAPASQGFPALGYSGGTPASGISTVTGGSAGTTYPTSMGLVQYTNVAAEFAVNAADPPESSRDQGENNATDSLFVPTQTNHRSWHPVTMPTGRTVSARTGGGTSFGNIRSPFNTSANIGYQTMHCSDCHGMEATGTAEPAVQGPHGSNNAFLLKGKWVAASGDIATISSINGTNSNNWLCGRCHYPSSSEGNSAAGGFSSGDASHGMKDKRPSACTVCHIAVPHGWKNKAFLVNLNCVQAEAGGTHTSTCTGYTGSTKYTFPPYYFRAGLRVATWQRSSNWGNASNCGPTGNTGTSWMSSMCEGGTQ